MTIDGVNIGSEIEVRSKRLQEELQNQVSKLSSMQSAIKQLKHDSVVTQSNIDKISGALQAYAETVRLANGEAPNLPISE